MSKAAKILIVEDEPDLQQAYSMILSSQGYDVSTANDGMKGLEKIKAIRPDLVLLDIFMPQMDGREFLRNLDLTLYPDTKIVVYSNLSDKAMEDEMVQLGAHDVVLKSRTGPTDLLNLVKAVLAEKS